MHRRGHVGVAMLAYAPVGFALLTERQLGLAVAGLFGVLAIEPLPDNDFWIPGLSHRGTSHSLFAAILVGGGLGTLGWVIGDQLGAFLAGLGPSAVGPFAGVFEIVGGQLRGLDERALSRGGFALGVFGILTHLIADAITVSGIRPLLPLSDWRFSLSSLRADNSLANNALFALGVGALVLIAFMTAPVGLVGVPGDLSPVGTAAGQSANATNTTNATVAFANQTTNGTNVTIESATLPEGGFIAIHSSGYTTGGASAESSVIATSKYLKSGKHTNVTVEVSNAPPGNYPGLNRSQLNSSGPLTAMAHRDTNGNKRMDFVASLGANDTAYSSSAGSPVADSAGITVPIEPKQQASVIVRNQTIQGDSVTVESARLPDGGFLVIHNESYRQSGGALESAVGVTSHLEAGQHNGVSVPLLQGAVESDQQLIAVPYRDTNNNQRYDYITSDGFRDVAYENRTGNQSVIVNDTARAVVSGSESTPGESEGTTSPANTSTPFRITNLSVSNRTARIDDEIVVTAQIENPTNSRLEDDLALATAGEIAETQDVALFPRESRAVTFEQSYDAAGEYIVKVGNRTERIRIVEEGAPLTTTTAVPNATANGSVESSEAMGLFSWPMFVALAVLIGAAVWGYRKMQGRDRRPR
ncbi:metal-dependent hydrolase [Halococcus sp. AFM35]|uniref:metal-dependent hydrolase n=1 Tax=Halococcus sp. AFM35 TaxID=3421653 RepID=UPI003EB721F5